MAQTSGTLDAVTRPTGSAQGRRAGQPAHDVFVSYSTRDKPVADAIVSRLEQAGIRCWVAPRDVLPGTVWGEAIFQAIETTRLMVVVLSGEANESAHVHREVGRAVAKDVVVVPFRIESVEPTGAMAYYLAAEHWLDAMTPPLESHISKLVQVAQGLLDTAPTPSDERREDEAMPAPPGPPAPPPARRRRWPAWAIGLTAVAALGLLGVVGLGVWLLSAPTDTEQPTVVDIEDPVAGSQESVEGEAEEPVAEDPVAEDPQEPAAESGERLVYLDDLRPGDCVLTPPEHATDPLPFWIEESLFPLQMTAVPCEDPHIGEVYFVGDAWDIADEYPGEAQAVQRYWEECDREFEQYVGAPYEQRPDLDYTGWLPDQRSWSYGDRTIACIAFPTNMEELEGSLRQ